MLRGRKAAKVKGSNTVWTGTGPFHNKGFHWLNGSWFGWSRWLPRLLTNFRHFGPDPLSSLFKIRHDKS